ncbi:MAG: chemotaxis protein CheB [Mucilaginibacter sp.]|uniref:chemotaxis protein CheB n=1 Tax=Mucilaginibacter sp. TaxID=1882438 RepID=UPI0034E46DD4
MENDTLRTDKNSAQDQEPTTIKKRAPVVRSGRTRPFPIVAIGGSAGAFNAFEKFFTHMPADSGMAFVLVMHLDPNYASNLAELIQAFTPMPVMQAEDGAQVKPNTVYVIPPDKDMGIHNRKLLLLNPSKAHGMRLPIDYFLQSLAEDQWNRAVGIILSGMGSDGETGLRLIKEKLGMAMVQDPETAQYDSMPKASIATNLVDYVLAPEEMPVKLIQYLNHPALSEEPVEQVKSEIRDSNSIQKILMLLRTRTGHDFSHYKTNTITRRIDRRLALHQLSDYTAYISFLRENPHELDALFKELLIGVTKFFRDGQAYESLKEKLLPILRLKTNNEPVRVWVAGSSTGEEAYTIAILLMECYAMLNSKHTPKIQIFATDLDIQAIETARSGTYHSNIVADVSPERLERFFIKRNEKYQVKKELREMLVFAQHNLIKDAPFTRLDLLSCRNVLIYLNAELQKKLMPIFHYSLNQTGILMLGPAETIGGFTDLFVPVEPKWKIFERKAGSQSANKVMDFQFNISRQTFGNVQKTEETKNKKKSLLESFNKFLLESFTPVSLLVNERGDILYINGKTGRFLELNPGEAAMNVFEMVREELKNVLRNAIYQAQSQKTLIAVNDIKIKEDGQTRLANLKTCIFNDSELQGFILIVIEDKGLLKKASAKINTKQNDSGQNMMAEELQKELEYTKQQLHSTIEQMETSLEELKSTNEELQSTNEELQSTNEESLTTKEEMQSLNEELMTTNVSYQAKAEELTRLNNDMKNLLDSTEIGTIFLDNQLMILRYTPQVKALFNVIASDMGRSITDIKFNFDLPDFKKTITDVIETLAPKEIEIKTNKNVWYNLRIMPYRTMDNFISGAVLTFTNISSLKIMEHRLKTMVNYSKTMVNQMQTPAILVNGKQEVIAANPAFLEFFKMDERQLQGLGFSGLVHDLWKTTRLDNLIRNAQQEELQVALNLEFPVIGKKQLGFTSLPSVDDLTGETLLNLIVIDDKKLV